MSIYEKSFAKSDITDAILVVDKKKLHVNKALLSYHSDYFKTLFNTDSKENSIEEIPIKDVKFDDFATLLSLVQKNPIKPTEQNAEKLLELADRFLLPAAKTSLELFLISSSIDKFDKICIGDKYQLDDLIKNGISQYNKNNIVNFYRFTTSNRYYQDLSDKTKVALLTDLIRRCIYE